MMEKALKLMSHTSGRRYRKVQIQLPRTSRLRRTRNNTFYALSVMALQTNAGKYTNQVRFDTDSAPIGIDNRCSACISHVAQDFIGPLRDSGRTIKGFAGSRTKGVKVGTLVWKWEDNDGKLSKFTIPNSYYVPEGKVRLLSPQHWAKTQESKQKKNKPCGTISQTTSEDVILMWHNRQSKLTVPLGTDNNVATFHLACGYSRYDEFCMEAQIEDDTVIIDKDVKVMKNEVNENPQKGVWSKCHRMRPQDLWHKSLVNLPQKGINMPPFMLI